MTNFWVFPLDNPISLAIENDLLSRVRKFLATWDSHGAGLDARAEIHYAQILIIYLFDQTETGSGCSIDSLKREVKQILELYNLTFLNSNYVILKYENVINYIKRSEISKLLMEGVVQPTSEILDLSMKFTPQKGIEELFIPLKVSWSNTYIT